MFLLKCEVLYDAVHEHLWSKITMEFLINIRIFLNGVDSFLATEKTPVFVSEKLI